MANQDVHERIEHILMSALPLIQKIEEKREGHLLLSFICVSEPIHAVVAYKMNGILRKIGKEKHLDVLLESGGGDIDSASKIAKLFKQHSKGGHFSVMVPFYGKSAAALIALCASEIIMPPSGELGPVDPQVSHPTAKEVIIPAHSIRDALEFIEATRDPYVKLTMADKLDPLMIGAYEHSQKASRQYVCEALETVDEKKRGEAIGLFTEELKSHGYPITKDLCEAKGLNICRTDEETEELACELHSIYLDALLEPIVERALIIQTSKFAYGMIDGIGMSLPPDAESGSTKENEPLKQGVNCA